MDNDFLLICAEEYKARGLKYRPSLQGQYAAARGQISVSDRKKVKR